MNVTVDLMEEEDIDGVLDISSLSFSLPWSKESYIQELNNPIAHYFVARCDDIVVGFVGTWIILDESHITNIAVHPNYRTQGIASKLLDELLTYCKSKGCIAYTLEVRASNENAQKLYLKHGFKKDGVRKGYYEDNKEDAILMWLRES
ncbi:ribosomal protein S18-alanine N-acetyltransferase [Clostridium saccharobutylicum]|uniref:[Ribosomal protein bS18]-alanine N-acetyltransferase n=1 Tax=Clostridium saccharobutylicum DSM 13864 TaxID=1345695 RepID=U5MQ87_CLOSA|nr:ribosomal protein S18-alanine N-acetyltransferase [Clostridium saccharobutylicum]AGX41587.1 putative ribosomal-protein-alanine acetyltransferase RimI [Clostridium saccharobutylicum DSM 13864]AQR88867.1 acetyltransferase YpeA [Clostridium saccharobutylicum]AQR98766.1 acetyltransferase YpeA [Clostridium saccharobutylicum]AQS08491.1 acetyltransferase YpeA [Clostridium saccharobutylicum]AQS12756.1 acetyltransferase YpeA [Clostridium saccharobutylicum]